MKACRKAVVNDEVFKENFCSWFCKLVSGGKGLCISGITRIFSCPPLDFSNDKKSIQTNPIGWWLTMFTNSALGLGTVLRKIHL